MIVYEIIDDGTLCEILNTILPYEKIKVSKSSGVIATWYVIDLPNDEIHVLIRQFSFEGETIGDVVFYHPITQFALTGNSTVAETSGIVATVINICELFPNVTTWFFSAKGGEDVPNKELMRRTSLYNRISSRMARTKGWGFYPLHSKGDTFYILSKHQIDSKKIYRFASTFE